MNAERRRRRRERARAADDGEKLRYDPWLQFFNIEFFDLKLDRVTRLTLTRRVLVSVSNESRETVSANLNIPDQRNEFEHARLRGGDVPRLLAGISSLRRRLELGSVS